jgi:hypothetical protein
MRKEAHTTNTITTDIRRSPKIPRLNGRQKNGKSKCPVPGFKEIMALYFELFAARFNAKPDVDGVDGKLLSGLIAKRGADEVMVLLRFFFDHPPAWVLRDSKFTIPAFKRSYTELVAQHQNGRIQQNGGFVG